MALIGNTLEQKIYNFLRSHGYSQTATAAIMGNLAAESGFQSNNLQNSYEDKYNDKTYTDAVDKNLYDSFATDSYGYGLAQWTSSGRKKGLLDYARAKGKSISDLETQLEYLVNELSSSYSSTHNYLKGNNSFEDMSNYFLKNFESPKDQSINVQKYRQSLGKKYLSLENGYNPNISYSIGDLKRGYYEDTDNVQSNASINQSSDEKNEGFWAPLLNWFDNLKLSFLNVFGMILWAGACVLLAWYLLNVKE